MRFLTYRSYRAALVALFCAGSSLLAGPPPARALDLISERQELEAGRAAAAQVEQKYRVVRGTRAARRVEQMGRRMAAVSGRPNIPWHFRVLEEPSVNAFAVPGYVYIHTGLLKAVGSDTDALAGVIAHEIAHTDARHSKKQMEKGAAAGLLIGILTKGGNNRNSGWFNLAGNVAMLKFSRDDEYEADRRAVGYMRRTGYDPNGMIRFFRKLQQREGRGNGVTTWFRTHPYSGDRINRLRRIINDR